MICVKCGVRLPEEASFCWKCGTAQPPPDAPAARPEARWETCSIEWGTTRPRGLLGGKGVYYFEANVVGAHGVHASRRSDEWEDPAAAPTAALARGELDRLRARLARDGWVELGQGIDWWSYRYHRPVGG